MSASLPGSKFYSSVIVIINLTPKDGHQAFKNKLNFAAGSPLYGMNVKNPVRTAKKAPHFTVTKINRLTLFKEIIAV
jgi:hypothetical protein